MSHCKSVIVSTSLLALLVAMPLQAGLPIFEDDFDAYTDGTYPGTPWTEMFGGVGGVVSAEQALSPPHSFRSESLPNWARWDYVTLTIPDNVSYGAAIYLTEDGRGGAVGFGFVQPGVPSTGWWANAATVGRVRSLVSALGWGSPCLRRSSRPTTPPTLRAACSTLHPA